MRSQTKEYTDKRWQFSCVHSGRMVFSAQLAEDGHAPLSLPARLAVYMYVATCNQINRQSPLLPGWGYLRVILSIYCVDESNIFYFDSFCTQIKSTQAEGWIGILACPQMLLKRVSAVCMLSLRKVSLKFLIWQHLGGTTRNTGVLRGAFNLTVE